MEKKCETCLYWHADASGEEGDCRLKPPTGFLILSEDPLSRKHVPGLLCFFPRTKKEIWCGAYTVKLSYYQFDSDGKQEKIS